MSALSFSAENQHSTLKVFGQGLSLGCSVGFGYKKELEIEKQLSK
jgi:hypothetical protein